MIIGVVVAVLALVAIVFFVVPAVKGFFAGEDTKVTAGQQVTVTIPDGASGDTIASILSENHIVENPKDYYAAVKKLNADMSLKPGTYLFTTLMDATKVVQQLMEGPNAGSNALTIPEGLTVDQVADRVAQPTMASLRKTSSTRLRPPTTWTTIASLRAPPTTRLRVSCSPRPIRWVIRRRPMA